MIFSSAVISPLKAALMATCVFSTMGTAAYGQQPLSPPKVSPDPRMVAAQQAFEALPETERKSIQQDLSFATSFNGAALGTFGSLTFTGIQNFEREYKLAVDGILTSQERQLLATTANNARKALKFSILEDAKSGVKIGIPQSIFTKRDVNSVGGSRWQSADGLATLDTVLVLASGETLPQLFEKAIAPSSNNPAGRKITYKLLRPDFFVVAGETTNGKFYRRMALGADGRLKGFAVGYDKAIAPDMDKLVIAVANTFEPFPTGNAVAAVAPAALGSTLPLPASVPAKIMAPRERLGSGLILDATTALTSEAAVKDCRAIVVGSKRTAARVVATDSALGLVLVKTSGLQPQPFGMGSGGTRSGGMGSGRTQGEAVVVVAQAWSGASPMGIFGEATISGVKSVAAPLQPGSTGGALFDQTGNLAGIIVDDPAARKQIAGVVPAARYRFASTEDVASFLQKQAITLATSNQVTPPTSVAGARRDAVTSVVCEL